ncbi:outer membrane beta-barrel protein, partial [Caulobacter sp. SLTY]|uniref:outer membrane protein n=1 Tax=Caulobacter sp. SLTY TaxID=2683262 RepID=UPI001413127B
MNKKALLLGGVLGALALAPQAMAQERGWYGAFDLGYHWPEGMETSSEGIAVDGSPYKYDFQQEDNLAGFARLGYQFAPNWRVELEGGVRTGDIESITGDPNRLTVPDAVCSPTVPVGPTCSAPQGSVESYTFMANVLYDFFPSSSFRPFVGAGIGVNKVKMDIGGRFNDAPAFGGWRIDDSDTAFAWQFIGGVSFDITQRLTADVTYRYLDGNDLRFSTDYVSTPPGMPAPGDIEGQYEDQSLTFGLRYSFAPAAAPPPPGRSCSAGRR